MPSLVFFKGLADETRLRLFRVLSESEVDLCVAELADIIRKPQYAVSRGLAELRKAGMIQEERQGKFVFYSPVSTESIQALGTWVSNHCFCDLPQNTSLRNRDGSMSPGADECFYDSERLKWRLSLRNAEGSILTQLGETDPRETRKKVLFVCVHNSARSQFAEEYLRRLAGDRFLVSSAGITPGALNPYVVAVLDEEGIDISKKQTRSVAEVYRTGRTYDWVITVCNPEAEKECPVFPGPVNRLSWPFPDPSGFTGTETEVFEQVRKLSREIWERVKDFAERSF